ncbi:MAG TPA: right-handed parallel beta-helix repeat-containing protein [Anaerolineales bacterium]|nr:right-handed parallel beta-helix repeat-containing protein [Anaerolineales bacterium]
MARTPLFSRVQPGGVFMVTDPGYTPGETFFVHSGTGTDGAGYGRNPDSPVATIDYAIGLCTANKGDVIYVLPGHNEGLGNAQIAVDVDGISIIGLGRGSAAPRIDFDHANASIDISADGCTLRNLRLLPSVTAVLIAVDVVAGATDTLLDGLETLPGEDGAGVDEFANTVDIKAGCDRTRVENCTLTQHASAAGVIACVKLTGASDGVIVRNCVAWTAGAGLVAPINGDTTLSTNLLIENCTLTTDAEPGIELLTGTTGVIRNVDIFSNLATIAAATVADGMAHFRVRYVEVGNESDAVVKTASIDD